MKILETTLDEYFAAHDISFMLFQEDQCHSELDNLSDDELKQFNIDQKYDSFEWKRAQLEELAREESKKKFHG